MAGLTKALSDQFEEALTDIDVQLLERLGTQDLVLGTLATEHASRTQALLRCASPSMQRNLLIIICKQLLKDANNVEVTPGLELCEGQPGAAN